MADSSRTTVAIWVVAAIVGGLALLHFAGADAGGGGGSTVRVGRPADGRAAHPGREGEGGGIFVHVAGAVRRPGLVELPDASRVAEAIQRAGGPLPKAELAGVNLAARVEDGQQVIVPVRGAAGAVPPAASAPGTAGGATGLPGTPPGTAGVPKLSLAAATIEQLDAIDGIGPTLAQRILEYRTSHGGFRSVGELREVEGIGEKRFATLREAVQP